MFEGIPVRGLDGNCTRAVGGEIRLGLKTILGLVPKERPSFSFIRFLSSCSARTEEGLELGLIIGLIEALGASFRRRAELGFEFVA
jgi:hypothetical protein